MRLLLVIGAAVVVGVAVTACSSTTSTSAPVVTAAGCASTSSGPPTTQIVGGRSTVLRIADLPAAVRAVEASRGGSLRCTEINATTGGVNVFVALDGGKESSYFYDGCRVGDAGAATVAENTAFGLSGVSLDVVTTLPALVEQKVPGALIESVALVNAAPDGVVWAVRVRSVKGGLVNLRFSPSGALIAAVDGGS